MVEVPAGTRSFDGVKQRQHHDEGTRDVRHADVPQGVLHCRHSPRQRKQGDRPCPVHRPLLPHCCLRLPHTTIHTLLGLSQEKPQRVAHVEI